MLSGWSVATAAVLFGGLIACLDAGYRLGRTHAGELARPHEGVGALEAAVFALLGLLLGFAFSGATSRLDARRQLVIAEANAIGTAYLRLDLLPAADQRALRELFRDYLDARLRVYDRARTAEPFERRVADAARFHQVIWSRAVAAAGTDPTGNSARLVLPAINEMIDVTAARTVALQTRLPALIFFLLIAVALLSALMGGYAMAARGRRSPFHVLLYAAAVSLTIYTVLDLDNPRLGLIRLDAAERVLRDLRQSIQNP